MLIVLNQVNWASEPTETKHRMCYRRDLSGYKGVRCCVIRSITDFEMAGPTSADRREDITADNKDLAFVNNTPVRDVKPGAPKTAGISWVCRSGKR
jgi:hypothetical protein